MNLSNYLMVTITSKKEHPPNNKSEARGPTYINIPSYSFYPKSVSTCQILPTGSDCDIWWRCRGRNSWNTSCWRYFHLRVRSLSTALSWRTSTPVCGGPCDGWPCHRWSFQPLLYRSSWLGRSPGRHWEFDDTLKEMLTCSKFYRTVFNCMQGWPLARSPWQRPKRIFGLVCEQLKNKVTGCITQKSWAA